MTTALGEGWEPVRRAPTYELVLDRVCHQIQSGRLGVGDRLPSERDLATGLGVSRVVVREAVGVLKALGIARAGTGSGSDAGTFLHPAPADALTRLLQLHLMLASVGTHDVVRARIALERESCRLAAEHATPADHAAMRENLAVMARPGIAAEEFSDRDTEFHVAIARASGNPLVAELTTALRGAMAQTLTQSLTGRADFPDVQQRLCGEHEGIFAALLAGSALEAADLCEAHIEGYYAVMAAATS